MRFSVTYNLEHLDLAYRMKIYSLIKEAVSLADKEYYEKTFGHQDNRMKNFTFSVYLHNCTLQDSVFSLDRMTINISSPDMEFFVHAFNGVRKIKEYKAGGATWVQSNLQLLSESSIKHRKVIFKTLSPLLIEDQNGKPLSPDNSDYESQLNYYADLQVKQFAKRGLQEPLRFTPLRLSKLVVKEGNRHLRNDDILYFTTYKGTFQLEGHPEDLQLLYQLGLGRRSTYFGMLDIVKEVRVDADRD
ncbi:CRISPR-associated endoribonuclease Cas6 [Bacillus massilinigeriensis]|uniref:CRISPR-associated endoribonuclease Cas6 n=1 Tax=Bacillus mediterraneensis TaxID=1805474 RepID=UPI0008F908E3|nr:CRISPR-associated endoribonuclease Cas6 [Bacillus mediterraneensis]